MAGGGRDSGGCVGGGGTVRVACVRLNPARSARKYVTRHCGQMLDETPIARSRSRTARPALCRMAAPMQACARGKVLNRFRPGDDGRTGSLYIPGRASARGGFPGLRRETAPGVPCIQSDPSEMSVPAMLSPRWRVSINTPGMASCCFDSRRGNPCLPFHADCYAGRSFRAFGGPLAPGIDRSGSINLKTAVTL